MHNYDEAGLGAEIAGKTAKNNFSSTDTTTDCCSPRGFITLGKRWRATSKGVR